MADPYNIQQTYGRIFCQYILKKLIESDLPSSTPIKRVVLGNLYKNFKTGQLAQSHPKASPFNFKPMMKLLMTDRLLQRSDGEEDDYVVSTQSQNSPRSSGEITKKKKPRRRKTTRKRTPSGVEGSIDEADDATPWKPVKVIVDQHLTMPRGPHRLDDIPTPAEMISPTPKKSAAFRQYCEVCDVKMTSQAVHDSHIHGKRHRIQCKIYALQTEKANLMADREGVEVSSLCDHTDQKSKERQIRLVLQEKIPCTVDVTIKTSKDIRFEHCCLLKQAKISVSITDEFGVSAGKVPWLLLVKDRAYQVKLTVCARQVGRYSTPLAFLFSDPHAPFKPFDIVRYLSAHCTRKDVEEFEPVSPYTAPPKITVQELDLEMVDGLPLPSPPKSNLERNIPLGQYYITTQLRRLANHGFKDFPQIKPADEERLLGIQQLMKKGLTKETYHQRFEVLLNVEELQMEVDIRMFDMEKVKMQRCPMNKRLLSLKVPGLAENRPSVLKGDHLYVRMWISQDVRDTKEYRGYVHDVQLEEVHLGFSASLMDRFVENMTFSVRFTFNRLSLRVMHRAALLAEEHSLGKMLFPTWETVGRQEPILPLNTKLRWFDRQLESNKEQCRAIQHIVSGTSRPAPYLLFGPPGTGKTVTLVEAIKQVEYLIPSAHILACAPSNSAADLLAERLLNHMSPSKVFRMNAMCRPWTTLPKKIQDCCNYDKSSQQYFYPSKQEIMAKKYKVLVCTLISASRIVSANFPPGYFTHVFIDEAGHAMEPEALIAVAGIMELDMDVKDGGQVVLAGDPKQLGPIIRSPKAKAKGLGLSLLERYMETTDVYKSGDTAVTAEAGPPRDNSCVLMKLVRNYRSHPAILQVPNKIFYDGELEVHADKLVRESLCNWDGLPKKGFPVIFHGVISAEMREEQSPSFFNPEEAATVLSYINDLLSAQGAGVKVAQKDIGVISPYRKQVQKIRTALLKKNLKDIKVGSVEEFQGQERLVMIISTVRSNPEFLNLDKQYKIGFLNNPKRFNVALTRAKALLVVIGNPLVLRVDKHWTEFLEFCRLSGAQKGCDYETETDRMDDITRQFTNLKLQDMGADCVLSVVKPIPDQPEWQHKM